MRAEEDIGIGFLPPLQLEDGFNVAPPNEATVQKYEEVKLENEQLKASLKKMAEAHLDLHHDYSKAYARDQGQLARILKLESVLKQLKPQENNEQFEAMLEGIRLTAFEDIQNTFYMTNEQLKKQVALITQKLQQLQEENKALEAANKKSEAEFSNTAGELKEELSAAKQWITTQDEELEKIKQERNQARMQLEATTLERNNARTLLENARATLEVACQLQPEFEKIQGALKAFQDQKEASRPRPDESSYESMKLERDQALTAAQSLRDEFNAKCTQLETLRTEHEKLSELATDMEIERDFAVEEAQTMTDDAYILREQLKTSQKKCEELTQDIKDLDNEHEQVKEELERMTDERNEGLALVLEKAGQHKEKMLANSKEEKKPRENEMGLTLTRISLEKCSYFDETLTFPKGNKSHRVNIRQKLKPHVKKKITSKDGILSVNLKSQEFEQLTADIGGELKWVDRKANTLKNKAKTIIPEFKGFSFFPAPLKKGCFYNGSLTNYSKFFEFQLQEFQAEAKDFQNYHTVKFDDPHEEVKKSSTLNYSKWLDLKCDNKEYLAAFIMWLNREYPLCFNVVSLHNALRDAKVDSSNKTQGMKRKAESGNETPDSSSSSSSAKRAKLGR